MLSSKIIKKNLTTAMTSVGRNIDLNIQSSSLKQKMFIVQEHL